MFKTYIDTPEERRNKTPEEIREYFNKFDFKTGKRYREIGAIREYEPTISLYGWEVPISCAESVQKSAKEAQEQGKEIVSAPGYTTKKVIV